MEATLKYQKNNQEDPAFLCNMLPAAFVIPSALNSNDGRKRKKNKPIIVIAAIIRIIIVVLISIVIIILLSPKNPWWSRQDRFKRSHCTFRRIVYSFSLDFVLYITIPHM